tara:strand:+ start:843 stop:1253 length:411 start_codon:yes stop_codon:yes gene_type:complete
MSNEIFADDQDGKVRIIAGRSRENGQIVFPLPQGVEEADYERIELPPSGTLWTYTVQRIPPKNPPFVGINSPDEYQPFAVGYVRLGDEVMIEGRIAGDPDSLEIGMPMDCVTISFPTADGAEMATYAFTPANGSKL